MKHTIEAKSDQLNSDDLVSGDKLITITGATVRGGADQPVSIHYEGDNGKPWKPCKTMCRVLVAVWGDDSKVYAGRALLLYRDPDVTWGGVKVTGIRIKEMSHIDAAVILPLAVSRGKKTPVRILPLKIEKPVKKEMTADEQQEWIGSKCAAMITHLNTISSVKDLNEYTSKMDNILHTLKLYPEYNKGWGDAYSKRLGELRELEGE